MSELKIIVAAQRDEIARLKGLKGRPSIKPSGMEKGTEAKPGGKRAKHRRRGKVTPRVTLKTEVLRAGLETADWVSVDDTGARHSGANAVLTQIGNDNFAWFGTTGSKSRMNFLHLLRAGERRGEIENGKIKCDQVIIKVGSVWSERFRRAARAKVALEKRLS